MLLAAPSAIAAQKLAFAPPVINLSASAGESVTTDITLLAPEDALTVELVHYDVGFDGKTYETRLIDDEADATTSFSTRGWFELPEPTIRIPAGDSRTVPLQVSVPRNTPGGTYIGAAIFRPRASQDEAAPGTVRAVGQTGPIIFVKVAGGEPPKPSFSTIDVPRITRSGPIRPQLEISNDGDDFFTFSGTVTLSRGGTTVDTAKIDQQYVVPDEPRAVRTAAGDDDGDVSVGSRSLGVGRYTLEVRLRTEPTGKTLVLERTIWVIPTWAWIIGILLLALVFGAGVLAMRRLSRFRAEAAATAAVPAATTTAPDAVPDDATDDATDDDVVSDVPFDESLLDDESESLLADDESMIANDVLTDEDEDELLEDHELDDDLYPEDMFIDDDEL